MKTIIIDYAFQRPVKFTGIAECRLAKWTCWFLNGKGFKDQAEWFQALTEEQKLNFIWSGNT